MLFSIAVLQSSDGNARVNLLFKEQSYPLWQPAVNKYRVHVWITTIDIATRTDWNVFLANVKQNTSKQHGCHVNCKTCKLSVTYVSFPGLRATSLLPHSKLQMTKAVVKTSFVQCTILMSIMSQLWAYSYKAHVHYKCRKFICKCIQSQRALLLCQLWTSCGQISVPSPYSTI